MKNIGYRLLPIAFLFGLSLTSFAQQAKPVDTPATDAAALKKHVSYLASDELDGRKPGTSGADKAAAYIADQFNRYGLGCSAPEFKCRHSGKKHGGYFKEFPFVAAVELAKKNSLTFSHSETDNSLAVRQDWMPIGYSSNGSMSQAQAIFVGYGITAGDLKHDDYANIVAKDKIAIALAGTPDGDNLHGRFARYAESRWKAVAAKDHGAKALIIIAREEKFGDDRMTRLRYDQSEGEAGIPAIVISRQTAAKWIGLGDAAQLNQLEKSNDKRAEAAQKLQSIKINLTVDISRRTVPAHNVVGVLEGNDQKLKREFIIIGAHYDHLGRGGESSRDPNSAEIHHGADDNASGVAGLLELARIFSSQRNQLRRSIIFIAFSAEESGLIGSKAYLGASTVPLADNITMLNMDMIGRLRDGKLTVGGIGTSPEFRQMVESLNKGAFTLQLSEDGFGPSDHSSFYAKQIPVLFFFTGTHDEYHKPSDTAEKINYEGQAKVVDYVSAIARELDRKDARPSYAVARSQSGGRSMSFRVYLGTVPNYAESSDGMLLDGVRDDSPAAKAGLKAGDKIVKLAGREVKNAYDYTYALGEMKPDQEYEVEILRGSEKLKLKLIPQVRK
jgi:hypothetical protein